MLVDSTDFKILSVVNCLFSETQNEGGLVNTMPSQYIGAIEISITVSETHLPLQGFMK